MAGPSAYSGSRDDAIHDVVLIQACPLSLSYDFNKLPQGGMGISHVFIEKHLSHVVYLEKSIL